MFDNVRIFHKVQVFKRGGKDFFWIQYKPQIGARGIDLCVPASQLGHGDVIARCNSITLIPRLDHVETITVLGDPGHGRVDARGG